MESILLGWVGLTGRLQLSSRLMRLSFKLISLQSVLVGLAVRDAVDRYTVQTKQHTINRYYTHIKK